MPACYRSDQCVVDAFTASISHTVSALLPRCSPMQTGRSSSNLCNRVDARSLKLCAIECQQLAPFAGPRVHLRASGPLLIELSMTDGFSRPYATVARVARSLSRPTTVVQLENRRSGSRESRAAPRWLKKGPQGCPINASEYDSSLRRPHKLPGAHLRSQKPGPRSHKHISTAVP